MQEPRLIRLMKSANTLIFFGVGLLMLTVLGYVAYQIYRDTFRERTASSVIHTALPPQARKTQMSLGEFTPLEGTSHYFAPVRAEQEYRQDYYDKTASSIRNYLFFNTANNSAVRLSPQNDMLFVRVEKLGPKNKAGNLTAVQGLLYEVVKTDTNGDQRLTEADQTAIALSDASGRNYTELLPNVDRVLGTFQSGPSKVILVYTVNQQNFVTEVDVAARQVVETTELPKIE